MRKSKKVLAFLITAVMVVTMIPMSVFAASASSTSQGASLSVAKPGAKAVSITAGAKSSLNSVLSSTSSKSRSGTSVGVSGSLGVNSFPKSGSISSIGISSGTFGGSSTSKSGSVGSGNIGVNGGSSLGKSQTGVSNTKSVSVGSSLGTGLGVNATITKGAISKGAGSNQSKGGLSITLSPLKLKKN